MRRLAIVACAALASCATTEPPPDLQPEFPTTKRCKDAPSKMFVGRQISPELAAEIMKATDSYALRWAGPGAYLTEDWHPWRLTVHYGADRKVTHADCG